MPEGAKQALLLGIPAALLEAILLVVRRLHPLDANLVEAVAFLLAATVVYFVAVWMVFSWRETTRAALVVVVVAAAVFRATLLPLPASLSDDLHRYQWEGKIQLVGNNPYRATPADPELTAFRPAVYDRLPGKDLTTPYGPATMLLFRVAAHLDGQLTFKILSVLFDFGCVLLLVGLLRRRGEPPARALVYAWCPLVVLEFAGSGHNDSIAVFFILLALYLARGAPGSAGIALAAATLSKWFAGLLAPVFLRDAGWPRRRGGWWMLGTAGVTAFLLYWPYADAGLAVLAGVRAYAAHWRNNASLFDLLSRLTGSEAVGGGFGFLVVAGLLAYFTLRGADPLRAGLILLAAVLLVSPSVFPWYITWLVPFLCFFPSPALLLWTATVLLSYHALIDFTAMGVWRYQPGLVWLEYLPVYTLLLWSAGRRWAQKP